MSKQYRVAIAGATGAVGVEFLRLLEERKFPMSSLRLLASARSAGKKMTFAGRQIAVEELKEDSFNGIDIAFFSAGGSISKVYGPIVQGGRGWWTTPRHSAWTHRAVGDPGDQPGRLPGA
jgi:aspartate-semialdehyde dehydrogenase